MLLTITLLSGTVLKWNSYHQGRELSRIDAAVAEPCETVKQVFTGVYQFDKIFIYNSYQGPAISSKCKI